MNTPAQTLRADMTTLAATITALRQIDGNRPKGEFLILELQKSPVITKYFRWLAEAPADPDLPLTFEKDIPTLPPHLQHLARGVADRTCDPGATPTLIAKALERAGRGQVERPAVNETIVIRIGQVLGDTATAAMLIGDAPVANMSLRVGHPLRAAIAKLKSMGVLFEGEPK